MYSKKTKFNNQKGARAHPVFHSLPHWILIFLTFSLKALLAQNAVDQSNMTQSSNDQNGAAQNANSQSLKVQNPIIQPPHYRGLAVNGSDVFWISGTRGSVLRGSFSNNTNIQWDTCKTNFPRKDFRDIWALDENTAIAMSVADSAVVIKTNDAGKNWQTVYHDETPGIFLDVIEIDPKTGVGIILGDPISTLSQTQQIQQNTTIYDSTTHNSTTQIATINRNTSKKHFKALLTIDFGSTWINIPNAEWSIPLDTLESFFAASGTSLSIIASKANQLKQHYSVTVGFAGGGHNPQFHMVEIKYQPKKMKPIHTSMRTPKTDGTQIQYPSQKVHKTQKVNKVQKVNELQNLQEASTQQMVHQPTLDFSANTHSENANHWQFTNLPTQSLQLRGGPAWGCYGLTVYQIQKGIAVGGNYAQPNFRGDSSAAIASYTHNIIGPWQPAVTPPNGYRSAVCISAGINKDTVFNLFFKDRKNGCETFSQAFGQMPSDYFYKTNHRKELQLAICTGTTGTDISFDGGKHWLPLMQKQSFNACVWGYHKLILVGNLGKVESFSIQDIAKTFQNLNPLSTSR